MKNDCFSRPRIQSLATLPPDGDATPTQRRFLYDLHAREKWTKRIVFHSARAHLHVRAMHGSKWPQAPLLSAHNPHSLGKRKKQCIQPVLAVNNLVTHCRHQ